MFFEYYIIDTVFALWNKVFIKKLLHRVKIYYFIKAGLILMKQRLFKSAIIAMVFVIAFVGTSCKSGLKNSNLIAEGVTVMGKNIGSLTREEAQKQIETIAKTMPQSIDLQFEYEDIEFSVGSIQIDLKPDTEKTLENAYKIGRGKDNSENKAKIKKAKKQGMDVGVSFSYDKDKFLLVCGDYLGAKIIDPSPMNVEIEKDRLIVTNAIKGIIVDIDDADRKIQKELADFKAQNSIELKLTEYTPKNLSFDEFKDRYKRKAKDAVYTKEDGKHNIEPEIIGVDFDDDEARMIFEENKNSKEPYEIPAKITYPKVTAKTLEDKYINNIIATYSTSYAGSSSGRIANIVLAAQKINGYVVNPGKRFSYNQVVGPRTAAAGFKIAHVYVGTKVVDGIGGGICQVSSTLYNAVVMADLKTVSRTNHSIPVSYVPLGRDATVSYGTIDYVFENNKPYPVSIKAVASGSTLTISIVGTSDVDYTVDFVSGFVASVPYSTVTEEDETLNEGETKVIEKGSNGSIYESYRVYKKDGVEYKRTFESKSRYQSVSEKIAVGVKKEEPPIEEIPPQIEQNNTPPENTEVSGEITEENNIASGSESELEETEDVQAQENAPLE